MNNPIAVSLAAGLTGLALWSGTATAPSPTDGPDAAYRILVQEDEEFRWSGAMQPGATLEIKGVNGEVVAEGVSGSQAEVVAVKKGKDDDPSEVRIEVVEHAGGVTICALHPRKPDKEPYECAPGKSGEIGAEDNDVSVKFTVSVPRGVNLSAQTVNGGIEAMSIDGDVKAQTVNGGVKVSATGAAQGQTVNGSVSVSMGRAEGPLSFQTVNGSITVELPGDAAADVRAQTVHGQINTDFPITIKGRFGMRNAQGTIGGGGPDLSLQTVNGSINLKRASG
jgi:hypothetical protein